MRADYHLHSHFSGDCKIPLEEMIQSAIALDMDILCVTDHHDLDFPHPTINFVCDLPAYYEAHQALKVKYQEDIQLLMGIELGMQPHLHETLQDIVNSYPFDFVLASNHLANGIDPYDKIYFEGRTQYKAYLDYFEDMLINVTGYSDFDVYSHLDYVIRYGDFPEKGFLYEDFKDVLDAILKTLIAKGKGIELNTSGYRYNLGQPHPSFDIIKHYKDLGGEIITIGSDAHHPKHLMSHFDDAKELLQRAGFKHYTIFRKRAPEFISLT